jgi:hypothetical protein
MSFPRCWAEKEESQELLHFGKSKSSKRNVKLKLQTGLEEDFFADLFRKREEKNIKVRKIKGYL